MERPHIVRDDARTALAARSHHRKIALAAFCAAAAFALTTRVGAQSAPSAPSFRGTGRLRFLPRLDAEGLRSRGVQVWLPAGYDAHPTRRYPVLYAHDGPDALADGGLAIARTVDALSARGVIAPHIVVAVDSTDDRTAELEPAGRRHRGPSLERYAALVVGRVVPLVDATFRTRADASARAIVGTSLGGLANLYIALWHPHVFGTVVCMSPSLWFHHGAAIDAIRQSTGPLPERVWIDAGTKEGRRGEVVPYFIRDVRALRAVLVARGVGLGDRLGYYEAPGAIHRPRFWRKRMRFALAFALRRQPTLPAPRSLSLHVFRTSLARTGRGARTTLAVTADYGRDLRLTLPNASVTLQSDAPAVATVAPDGAVEAHAAGDATIDARAHGLNATATVHVH